jgi:aminopeptidase N
MDEGGASNRRPRHPGREIYSDTEPSRIRFNSLKIKRSARVYSDMDQEGGREPLRNAGHAESRQAFARRSARALAAAAPIVLIILALSCTARADQPYAPSRDYDLQNIRTHLWFDTSQRKIRGEVTEDIAALRDNLSQLKFDSVALQIESVTVDGGTAKFSVTPATLLVSLDQPTKIGQRHEILIRYEGQPHKGLYFVLPDKDYPQFPNEIWTQGEAEDTRYYIPLYDYPNDRTASEMLLTVPASWITISNGDLVDVKNEADGTKTWDWKLSKPLSTYLISAIAGDFVEQKESWRGIPLRFVVPRSEESKIAATFPRTKEMLDLFSEKLGVPYPWPQYAQTSVDDFVAGGMENTSATTLSTSDLIHPLLVAEQLNGSDDVYSHELAHQWFGDLVTCKDWGNLWLNEGFATFFEHYWMEQHYGADDAAYEYWRDRNGWFQQTRLYPVPILNRNFTDSVEYAGNVYDKAGWALEMLREKLGDADFFLGLHHYLEQYRGQNVVSPDLQKSIEEATSTNVDQFFHQWIYRAGAPKFAVSYSYDSAAKQAKLDVKQTQKIEGLVRLFDVPIDIEIATASSRHTFPVEISEADHSFSFAVDGPPLMVVFDKGDKILKSVDFQKDPALWIYQLKNAETVPDRADAAVALGALQDNPEALVALGEAAQHDPFWGIRAEALRALGRIGGPEAETYVITAAADSQPWVRDRAVRELGNFKQDAALLVKLGDIAAHDTAYRVRASALRALAQIKSPGAYDTLTTAVNSESPDDTLRTAALEGLGILGDSRAVPVLLAWSVPGKPFRPREAAIEAVAGLDKKNKQITQALVSYLSEPYFDVSMAAIFALWERGDPDAIVPLERMLKSGDYNLSEQADLERAIRALKNPQGPRSED